MLSGRLLVADWYCGLVLYMFDLWSWQFSGVYGVVQVLKYAVQLCFSAACIDSCLCNTYRSRTARDTDILVVFHMLFLAVVILPFCDSQVLISNTALDVGSSSLKYSYC